ncbi:Neuron-derived Neurotrophic Factor C-terminal [Popillia japonica]|uniref:Neuron-derived Neurotrophic Factor C-terminal n=1 Tax=Popillia japonica TaxID=7064 RepID=A0AAW1ITJ9_POPJA
MSIIQLTRNQLNCCEHGFQKNYSNMLCFNKLCLTLCIILTVLRETECRRMKKSKIIYQPPALIDYPNTKLPSESQVTVYLQDHENKTFYFVSSINNVPLSISIVSCSSPIYWSLAANNSDISSNISLTVDTYNFRSAVGLYVISLYSERHTYAHIYITRTIELPSQILDESKNRRLKLLKRRRRRKLTARWDQSLVDPYATTYCLVINSQRPYSTLCSAQNDVINPRQQNHKMHGRYQMSTVSDYQNERKVPKIICTGNKTHYTLTNLQQDMNYYFNGWKNCECKFEKAGRESFFYNVKPVSLRDGKIASANLKKLDGKAFFTYKSEKRINSTLTFLIIPCGGGAVDVTLKYNVNRSKKKIRRLGIIQVKEPSVNSKYHIKILSQNRYDFSKASGVKILATSRASKIPFPSLPTETIVHEYISLRKCDGVTIGWYAAPTNGNNNYCIAAKRGKLPENLTHKAPDNCKIDYEMRSLMNVSYCKRFNEKSGEIIIEHIENLSPDESYIIYVTVKKEQGKSLAYDLLQVYTKPECD